MERMEQDRFNNRALLSEHVHRYLFVKPLVKGVLVDCACGTGYGSKILEDSNCDRYIGIDSDKHAIITAKKLYQNERIIFLNEAIYSLSLEDSSVDSFIMMETLEHLDNPRGALKEILRVLKNDGVLVGSVPSKYFDTMCENIYGKNEYHINQYDSTDLENIFGEYFKYVHLFSATFDIGTNIIPWKFLESTNKNPLLANYDLFDSDFYKKGSIIFVARNIKFTDNIDEVFYFYGLNKTEYDEAIVVPATKLTKELQTLLDVRDETIEKSSSLVIERNELIKFQNKELVKNSNLISAKDSLISDLYENMKSKEKICNKLTQLIVEKDKVNKHSDFLVEERDYVIGQSETIVSEQAKLIVQLKKEIDNKEIVLHDLGKHVAELRLEIDHKDELILEQKIMLDNNIK